LIRIHIPWTVEDIEGHVFHGRGSLGQVKFLGFQHAKELQLGSLVMGPSAFFDCSSLRERKIPVSLEKISKSCFHTCAALRKISLPEGLLKVKANTFIDLASLEYVRIPSTVEIIQWGVFSGAKRWRLLILEVHDSRLF